MSEFLAETEQLTEFEAVYPGVDPSLYEQAVFFQRALAEAESQPDTTRYREGSVFGEFREILNAVNAKLEETDATLTPEHLIAFNYMSDEAQDVCLSNTQDINVIKEFRFEQIDKLVDDSLLERLSKQNIAEGTLDIPPYCKQGDGWDDARVQRGCMNACFRMVTAGLTGLELNEGVVAEKLITHRGSHVVDDTEYQKLLRTDSFQALSGKKVSIIDVMGADFSTINQISSVVRNRCLDAQVYAIASLTSTAGRDIWHACLLLNTTETDVICHDPQKLMGRACSPIPRTEFTQRWAGALNRVQLVIAT
jgi:hypothetical protein